MIGKEIRLKRLFGKSNNTFILPMDHGVTIGPADGLQDILPVVQKVRGKVDAVIIHKGLVGQLKRILESNDLALIVHLSASTKLAPDPNEKKLVTSVEQAIKLGATAVSIHVNLGAENEPDMLKDLGNTAEACDSWGMPLLAMMYVREAGKASEYDPEKIRHAARVAEEMGADIAKVNYTGSTESFSEVVRSVKIPVIIAGGPRMSSDAEVIEMVKSALKAGARGVAIGRNIFQNEDPAKLSGEISRILHGSRRHPDIF